MCTFGTEVLRLLGFLSRVVPGLGAEVLRAFVEFVEDFARMRPVVIVGTKSCMRLIIRAFYIFVPSVDELIFQRRFLKDLLLQLEPAGCTPT